jgi:hypothetical protein
MILPLDELAFPSIDIDIPLIELPDISMDLDVDFSQMMPKIGIIF